MYGASCFRRITPACAGKTAVIIQPLPRKQDHPRVCGENRTYTIPEAIAKGSPPRVRGKLPYEDTDAAAVRITPACAGKTA